VPNWEFRDPLFLIVGLTAPLVYWLAARLPSVLTYSNLALVDAAPRSQRARLAKLPALLLAVAALAMTIALAGPRTGNATSRVNREGIAIAIAVDRSGSMQARDFVRGDTSVSRLDVVKDVFRVFVSGEGKGIAKNSGEGRPDDLVGLVVFARYADGVCPLTMDHGNLLSILADVEIPTEQGEDGTALGEGLALAVERLRSLEVSSKVILLLTDGVSNSGDIAPLQAADLAAQHGIKVYAIGAGRSGYAPVPVQGPGGRVVLQKAYVEIDEETLRQIAERTGGRYFHATNAKGLGEVIAAIDKLERSEVTEVRYLTYDYHHAQWVSAALFLMVAAAMLSGTWLRRLP
jgi:Ca-activated chloride channel family protein